MTPAEARAYIAVFRKHAMSRQVDFVDVIDNRTNTQRRIELDDMTDDDALMIAEDFKEMEVKAAELGKARGRRPN